MNQPTDKQKQEARELLACPFCGRKARVEEFRDGNDPQPLFVVTCEVCPIKTYDQFTAEEAAQVWNARAAAVGPRSLFPQGDWQHVQIKAGNPRVVAIQFETAEQATEFINTFATLSSRDQEIREVLEGVSVQLGVHRCWCTGDESSSDHTNACLAARRLWERVQVSVRKEESNVVK